MHTTTRTCPAGNQTAAVRSVRFTRVRHCCELTPRSETKEGLFFLLILDFIPI